MLRYLTIFAAAGFFGLATGPSFAQGSITESILSLQNADIVLQSNIDAEAAK